MHSELKSIHFNIHKSIFLKIWIHFNSFQSILVFWVDHMTSIVQNLLTNRHQNDYSLLPGLTEYLLKAFWERIFWEFLDRSINLFFKIPDKIREFLNAKKTLK